MESIGTVVHIPGPDLPMASIADQIPAPQHVRFEGDRGGRYWRSDFVTQSPHALGAFELRGATWVSIAIVLVLLVGLPIATGIGALLGAILTAATS